MSESRSFKYSGHSMRRGGATAAAAARISAYQRMIHGRWTDQKSADGYLEISYSVAMEVTGALEF